jgi:hypothetical protein
MARLGLLNHSTYLHQPTLQEPALSDPNPGSFDEPRAHAGKVLF